MTKKDYVLIAQHLNKLVQPYQRKPGDWGLDKEDHHQLLGMEDAMEAVADALQADNPRFDKSKFLKACGHRYVK